MWSLRRRWYGTERRHRISTVYAVVTCHEHRMFGRVWLLQVCSVAVVVVVWYRNGGNSDECVCMR